ncbi:MAG: phosphoglycolate phosphatase [Pseudomonadota bacterium]
MTDPTPLAGASVIFDLDGTLVETAPDLAAAMNAVLVADGLEQLPLEEVRHLVGHGARALLRRGYAAHGRSLEDDELEERVVRFIDHYRPNVAATSHPFEGVEDALERLRDVGAALSVCTNKPEALAVDLLRRLNLAPYFAGVVGGDTLVVRKPAPDPLLEAVRRAGGSTSRMVMVGDSSTDVKAARAAGAAVVVVSFGYSDGPPAELGADAVIDHFDALFDAASRLA